MKKIVSTATLLLASLIPNYTKAQDHCCPEYQQRPGLSCEQRITTFEFYTPKLSWEKTKGNLTTCHPHFQYQGSCLQKSFQKVRCAGEGALKLGAGAICVADYAITAGLNEAGCALNTIGEGFDCLGKKIGKEIDNSLLFLDRFEDSISNLNCRSRTYQPKTCEPIQNMPQPCQPSYDYSNPRIDPFLQRDLREQREKQKIYSPLINPDNGPWNNRQ